MKKYPPELKYILNKYDIEPEPGQTPKPRRMPIEIPNVGRRNLAALFAELDYTVGVEVGVERASYSKVLCKNNPQATIYGLDAWQAYSDYREHVNQERLDGFLEQVKQRMEPYPNYRILRAFSMDAVGEFEDGSLDFVYIDGNHTLPFVMRDILEWGKKVRTGGIISGHDYRASKRLNTQMHVVYAVKCYTSAYRVFPWFLLGRKKPEGLEDEVRDNSRSWMWVKRRWEP